MTNALSNTHTPSILLGLHPMTETTAGVVVSQLGCAEPFSEAQLVNRQGRQLLGAPGHQGAPNKKNIYIYLYISIIPMAFTTCLTKMFCQTLTKGSRLCFSRANHYIYVLKIVLKKILTVQADIELKSRAHG